ncbi:MAG: GNAT family protein [Anaerolineales bacterium]
MSVELKPFDRSDFGRLIRWIPNAEAMMMWCGPFFTFPLDVKQLEEYYQSGLINPPLRKIFKAVDAKTHEVIGHIELNNIDWRNLSATVSKVLIGEANWRGQGYGTQMVQQLLRIAFDELRLHRVSLYVFDFNQPAIACYKKAGFEIEGYLRDYRKVGETYWSSYLMAILESDWLTKNRK